MTRSHFVWRRLSTTFYAEMKPKKKEARLIICNKHYSRNVPRTNLVTSITNLDCSWGSQNEQICCYDMPRWRLIDNFTSLSIKTISCVESHVVTFIFNEDNLAFTADASSFHGGTRPRQFNCSRIVCYVTMEINGRKNCPLIVRIRLDNWLLTSSNGAYCCCITCWHKCAHNYSKITPNEIQY